MAFVPECLDITARVSFPLTASIVIDAVRDEIFATGTHLKIDAYTVTEGLTIGFVDAGEDHQVNLRKSGASTIAISVEPSGSITLPGDSTPTAPTGTSLDWSGVLQEPDWDVTLGTPAAGSRVWLVECIDAFFVMITDPTNTFQLSILYAGRIASSTNSSTAAAVGQDGLGYLAGVPDGGTGSANDWISTVSPCASLHWGTNEWCQHINWLTNPTSSHLPNIADVSVRFIPPIQIVAVDINGTSSDGVYGIFKYIRTVDSGATLSKVDDSLSNQSWLRYNDVYSASSVFESIIWSKLVTP